MTHTNDDTRVILSSHWLQNTWTNITNSRTSLNWIGTWTSSYWWAISVEKIENGTVCPTESFLNFVFTAASVTAKFFSEVLKKINKKVKYWAFLKSSWKSQVKVKLRMITVETETFVLLDSIFNPNWLILKLWFYFFSLQRLQINLIQLLTPTLLKKALTCCQSTLTFSYMASVSVNARWLLRTHRWAQSLAFSFVLSSSRLSSPTISMCWKGAHTFGKSHCSPLWTIVVGTPPGKSSSLVLLM